MNDQAQELKRKYNREYRQKNKEELNEYYRKWRQKNQDKVKAAQERYWNNKARNMKGYKEGKVIYLNEDSKDVAEIFIYGPITKKELEEESCTTTKQIRDTLKTAKVKKIKVYINSGGGDVFESIAIHNILRNSKANIEVYIEGIAASGASIIAMAGDVIYMPENTLMMIHKTWTCTAGNAEELRKIADDLTKMDAALKETYKKRFNGTDFELENLLSNETWLKADKCKELGLCDYITDSVEEKKVSNSLYKYTEPKKRLNQVLQQFVKNVDLNEIINSNSKGDFRNEK